MRTLPPLVAVLGMLLACGCVGDEYPVPPGGIEHLFSFVVIADPHIAGPIDHEARLQIAIDWINEYQAEHSIEVVLVLGDIGWNDGLARAAQLLGDLELPWVPISGLMGNNPAYHGGYQWLTDCDSHNDLAAR